MTHPATGGGTATPKPLGSLRGQLLRWLLIPLVILVGLDAISVYYHALDAADLAYDRTLLASARSLAERVRFDNGKVTVNVPYVALDSFEADTLGRLYYKVTGIHGEFVSGFDDLPPLPPNVPRSDIYPALVRFYHATYHGDQVRIAALYQPVYDDSMRGIAMIQVGESVEARTGLSRAILFDTLWRQAALVIAVAVLVWFTVRIVLLPLTEWRRVMEARAPTDLSGFDVRQVHKEMRPLVAAMNGYMARLNTLITSQRRFIADASHQLRTPLTVLKTQSELALRESDPAAMRQMIQSIAATTDATVHLANRLLTLARAEHGNTEGTMQSISLTDCARQVAMELAPAAIKKGLDLALDADNDIWIDGNPLLLHEMIINVLDNAIQYTPAGGNIVLRTWSDDDAVLEIEDSGIGIPAGERERVFAPFYRASSAQASNANGTGLGLTIVRDIAALHNAQISLENGLHNQGLKVTIRFLHNTRVPSMLRA